MAARSQTSQARNTLIPGLDPDAPYASRLSARSALYTDLRLLLDDRTDALKASEYRALIMDENCLGRSSASARRKTWKELHARYRLDAGDPLFATFWSEWRRSESEAERALTAYVLFALNDRLVADLGTEWLFPRLRRAPSEVRPGDVQGFIAAAARAHPEVSRWSEATTMAVASKYCASIRDFGLAKGIAKKATVRPALYGAPVRLLIRALRMVDTSVPEVVRAPVFRLLGIETHEVIEALSELNRTHALRFRMQGDVVELNLPEGA